MLPCEVVAERYYSYIITFEVYLASSARTFTGHSGGPCEVVLGGFICNVQGKSK